MSKISRACELALAIANDPSHGYSQASRWGPDFDCSSFLIYVWQTVGVPVKDAGATYTGNMKAAFLACGFADVTASVNLATGSGCQPGDILLNQQNHTAMSLGNGRLVHASTAGGHPEPGDQTGGEILARSYYNFPWDCVLRYVKDGPEETPAPDPELEAPYEAEGIDVSAWQGENIDFEKVKASGKKFVIIRAGYRQTVDKHWEENYKKAKAAGLAVGAYWFQYAANVTAAQKEAAACIKALSGKQLEFPVYYDLEPDGSKTPPTSQYNANAYAFCQKLEAAGYFTGIYTSESFLQYFDAAFKERFTLWVANWSRKPALGAVWQKSSEGSVPGISGNVDLDVCYQDFPTIIKKARLNGFGDDAPAPDPEPTPAPAPDPEPETTVDGTVMDLATRVIQGEFGVGSDRKARLGDRYDEVQSEVNHRLTASVETVAREAIAGRYGNGEDRKRALGYRYGAVQARVNSILR